MKENEREPIQEKGEIEKQIKHLIVQIIEYIPNAVLSRTIIKKLTGNITAMSFDSGEEIGEKSVPFDTYIQIIDGQATITINNTEHYLTIGNGIVIPAHSFHSFSAKEQLKMISTVIKSGYENQMVFPVN
jgi:quercetin dioxygenase-like cupin family protein